MITLVEFFNDVQIENVVGSLVTKPDKVIFIGYEGFVDDKLKEKTKTYLKIKGIRAFVEFVEVEKNLKNIIDNLTDIYLNNTNCIFDFTGGEELIFVAMGYVMAKYAVTAMEVDVDGGLVYKDLVSNDSSCNLELLNSIEENIYLHGGIIDKRKQKSSKYLKYDIKDDVYDLWDVCKTDNAKWNSLSGILKNLSENEILKDETNEIFGLLVEKGFINILNSDGETLSFEYKNNFVKHCIFDPGAILELYTYFVLCESNLFNDVMVGVYIDWDGVIHGLYDEDKDTSNEIDVVVMKGLIPVYISCKNGKVTKETLYELETVGNRFGGKYSKKVLVAPALKEETSSNEYLHTRASDMGIKIITDISQMTKEKFVEEINNI